MGKNEEMKVEVGVGRYFQLDRDRGRKTMEKESTMKYKELNLSKYNSICIDFLFVEDAY